MKELKKTEENCTKETWWKFDWDCGGAFAGTMVVFIGLLIIVCWLAR